MGMHYKLPFMAKKGGSPFLGNLNVRFNVRHGGVCDPCAINGIFFIDRNVVTFHTLSIHGRYIYDNLRLIKSLIESNN